MAEAVSGLENLQRLVDLWDRAPRQKECTRPFDALGSRVDICFQCHTSCRGGSRSRCDHSVKVGH